MPKINDIVQVAESLEKSPIAVIGDRCVAVRNRNASCRACVQVCQVNALSISANEIHLDAAACMACGACASVCPTEALVPLRPTDAELASRAAAAASAADGHAVIACARIASKRVADPALYAEVPCLARVEEGLLVNLAAHGAHALTLVDGACETCKYGACAPVIEAAALYADELLEAHGSPVRVQRASAFPREMLVEDARGLFGSTRRGFFSEAAGAAKETALSAARVTIEQELGIGSQQASIGERLRVTEGGSMPRLTMPRHDATINAMDAIGLPRMDCIETRRFGSVSIDPAVCNACGMCAVFCTTGALRRSDAESPSAPLKQLEFSASECVQCGLCRDVCWKHALSLSGEVSTEQLFDFEPLVFEVGDAGGKKGLFA